MHCQGFAPDSEWCIKWLMANSNKTEEQAIRSFQRMLKEKIIKLHGGKLMLWDYWNVFFNEKPILYDEQI